MNDILIAIDLQNDFIDGALGTPEAVAILPAVMNRIKSFSGKVIFTRDTHSENYMDTQEGKLLPVKHCIRGTFGWQIREGLCDDATLIIDKPSFGSMELAEYLKHENDISPITSITLIGLCTDICVISNALIIKAALPEIAITTDAACCAGVTPESHKNALSAMRMCQIDILNA